MGGLPGLDSRVSPHNGTGKWRGGAQAAKCWLEKANETQGSSSMKPCGKGFKTSNDICLHEQ